MVFLFMQGHAMPVLGFIQSKLANADTSLVIYATQEVHVNAVMCG